MRRTKLRAVSTPLRRTSLLTILYLQNVQKSFFFLLFFSQCVELATFRCLLLGIVIGSLVLLGILNELPILLATRFSGHSLLPSFSTHTKKMWSIIIIIRLRAVLIFPCKEMIPVCLSWLWFFGLYCVRQHTQHDCRGGCLVAFSWLWSRSRLLI